MSLSFIGRTASSTYITVSANNKVVSKFTLSESAKADFISIKFYGSSANSYVKGVIYSDNEGAPNALLGVTRELQGVSGSSVNLYFDTAIVLSPGDYHIGIIVGNASSHISVQASTGTNNRNSDTYSDGPSDPFGTPGTELTSELCVGLYYVAGDEQDVTKAYGAAVLVPDDIEVTKTVAYAVVAPNDYRIFKAVGYAAIEEQSPGPLDASKVIGYSVLSAPDALDASKVIGYAVLSTEVNVAASKVVGYAVLEEYHPPVRVTQQYVEAAARPEVIEARITQQYIEVAYLEKDTTIVAPCVFVVT